MRCYTFAVTIGCMCLLAIAAGAFAQSIAILSPGSRSIFQQSNGLADITVSVSVTGVPLKGGVEFVLDQAGKRRISTRSFSSPYQGVIRSVLPGEHTLDAYVIDSAGRRLSAHDSRDHIGVGEIIVALGDSITAGEDDDFHADDWSADGRNGPYIDRFGTVYGGFEPILNDLLTADRGCPHSVINQGMPSELSAGGVSRVTQAIAQNPTAKTWLVAYGTNDANQNISVGAFKANIQSIITKIQSAIPGAKVYVPKIFYCPKTIVASYHNAIGDIVRNTPNVYWGADLDTLFRANHSEYDHLSGEPGTWISDAATHHPNGVGVQKMAMLWEMSLVDRAILVTDGVLPSTGDTWADKIHIDGANTIGLSENNLLMICEQLDKVPVVPAGTLPTWPSSYLFSLTGSQSFASGGSLTVTLREEDDTGDPINTTSWNQLWLAEDTTLLATTRQKDPMSKYNEDLIAVLTGPGQLATVGDITPPVTTCTASPASPDGADGTYSSAPRITLSASDGTGRPVASTRYHLDSGREIVYTKSFTTLRGTHTLYYYSIDQSGNAEAVKSMVLKVK